MIRKVIYSLIILVVLLVAAFFFAVSQKKTIPQTSSAQLPQKESLNASTGELFVSNGKTNSILVFNAAANGNISPLREIKGMSQATGIALDIVTGEIYVAEPANNSVSVFDKNANGTLQPLRSLNGLHTNLDWPQGIAINAVDDEIYIPNLRNKSITAYARTSQGNAGPLRMINGKDTDLIGPVCIAYDEKYREILVINHDLKQHRFNVIAFDKAANGNVKPKRYIFTTDIASDAEISPEGIAIDSERDQILITYSKMEMPDYNEYYIEVYKRTAEGNIVLLKRGVVNMSGMDGVAIDMIHGEVFVTNSMSNEVLVYKRDQAGNIAPSRIITGPATGLSYPRNVVVHSK